MKPGHHPGTIWLMDLPTTPLRPAALLDKGQSFGRYVVLGLLGRGGMGDVYAAWDPQLDRKVALKRVRPGQRGEDASEARSRLLREARALARLSHPNVVPVHEVSELEGAVYLAMEHVDGEPLSKWLASGPRTVREVLSAFREAGLGLLAAHEAGLVHRDFKPANVLIGKDGRIRVLDFGLARSEEQMGPEESTGPVPAPSAGVESTERLTIVTQDGLVVGTPGYMAPEQLRGDPLDARTDQYAFCLCLFEALHGAPPFTGRSPAALLAEMEAERVAPVPVDRKVPKSIHLAMLRGLAASPERRFASMRQLLAALEPAPRKALGRTAAITLGVVVGATLSAAGFAMGAPRAEVTAASVLLEDAALQAELVAARHAFEEGRLEEALALAVKTEGEHARAPRTATAASILVARVLQANGELKDAERTLHRAAQQAEVAGDDELRARALVGLVLVVGIDGGRTEEGRRWAAYARAVMTRAGMKKDALSEQLSASEKQLEMAAVSTAY